MVRKPPDRQQRRAAHQEATLDAAVALLDRHGPEGLTMPALAQEVGAAVGALYRWFPSKEALLVALQLRAIDELADLLAVREAAAGDDALHRVRVVFGTWAVWATRSPALFALVDGALSDPRRQLDADLVRPVDEAMAEILARCAASLANATQAGVLSPGDPGLRALALFAAVRGARHLTKRDDRAQPGHVARRIEAELVETLLRGWS
jgi:AcrR family transcriptional regulator